MAITLNDNLQINAGKPIDSKYFNASGVPYASLSEVLSTVGNPLRYQGLTVNVLGSEYWFQHGITNSDLVFKNNGGTNGTAIVGASYIFTNGLTESNGTAGLGGTLNQDVLISGNNGAYSFVVGDQLSTRVSEFYGFASNTAGIEVNDGVRDLGLAVFSNLVELYAIKGPQNSQVEITEGFVEMISQNSTSGHAVAISASSNMSTETGFVSISGTFPNFQGAKYAADYSANYTSRSLVDKNYVDTHAGSASNGTSGWATNAGNAYKLQGHSYNEIVGSVSHQIPFVNNSATGFSYLTGFTIDPSSYSTQIVEQWAGSITGVNDHTLIFGEAHTILGAPSGGGTVTDAAIFGIKNTVGDSVRNFAGASSFTFGGSNVNAGLGSYVGGIGSKISASTVDSNYEGGFAHAFFYNDTFNGLKDVSIPYVLAYDGAGNISRNTVSQTDGHGSLGRDGFILGGYDHHIPVDSQRSIILGGHGIVARSSDPDQVYVPNLNIAAMPALAGTNGTQVLVRDSSNGKITYVDKSSLTGGSSISASNGLTITGGNVELGGALTETLTIIANNVDGGKGIIFDDTATYGNGHNDVVIFSGDLVNYTAVSQIITSMGTNGTSGSESYSTVFLSSSNLLGDTNYFQSSQPDAQTIDFQVLDYSYPVGSVFNIEMRIPTDTHVPEMFVSASQAGSPSTQFAGIQYSDDYSGAYTSRSLVDKAYVDAASVSITASNGLTKITTSGGSGDIKLGGSLTGDTTIDGAFGGAGGNYDLTFSNIGAIDIAASQGMTITSDADTTFEQTNATGVFRIIASGAGANISLQADGVSIINDAGGSPTLQLNINTTDATFIDARGTTSGLEYFADYSSGYSDRSLVDKGYVTSMTSLATGITTASAPSTSSDTAAAGQIRFDSAYLYIAVATDTWMRVALSSF